MTMWTRMQSRMLTQLLIRILEMAQTYIPLLFLILKYLGSARTVLCVTVSHGSFGFACAKKQQIFVCLCANTVHYYIL